MANTWIFIVSIIHPLYLLIENFQQWVKFYPSDEMSFLKKLSFNLRYFILPFAKIFAA